MKRAIEIAAAAVLCLAMSVSAAPADQTLRPVTDTVTQDGITYGPSRRFAGVYVTNFEINHFRACGRTPAACKDWTHKEGEWLRCAPDACADLDQRVSRLNGSTEKWGAFLIEFTGRRSAKRSPKAFLHDTESKVYVERVERVELLEAQ